MAMGKERKERKLHKMAFLMFWKGAFRPFIGMALE
jgi:hypothetical protein